MAVSTSVLFSRKKIDTLLDFYFILWYTANGGYMEQYDSLKIITHVKLPQVRKMYFLLNPFEPNPG